VRGKNIIPHIQTINVEYVEYIKIHQNTKIIFRIFIFQWIGLRENLQESPIFNIF